MRKEAKQNAILATLIKNRLEQFAKEIRGEYQCGFQKNRETMDQVFTLK